MKPVMYKTVVIYWSTFDPDEQAMTHEDLAIYAASGGAVCTSMRTDEVTDPSFDSDWDSDVDNLLNDNEDS